MYYYIYKWILFNACKYTIEIKNRSLCKYNYHLKDKNTTLLHLQ